MADSCELPPTDFHLYSSVETSSTTETPGAIRVAIERCALCGSSKRAFFCKNCVNQGSFAHSRTQSKERCCDKLQRWLLLKRERSRYFDRFHKDSQKRISLLEKRAKLADAKDRLTVLQAAILDGETDIEKSKTLLAKLKESNHLLSVKAGKHNEKKNHIRRYIDKSTKYTTTKWLEVSNIEEDIIVKKKEHLRHLQEFIFPILEMQPRSEEDVMAQSMVSALAEARHTAYVRGRWIYTDNSGELHYRIIEPSLPGNGDYSSSAYNVWLQEAHTDEPDFEPSQRNPLFNVCAALAYTTQMLNLLVHFLDINLPHKLCYSVFFQDLSVSQFRRAVYKLNHNVLHACFTQDVPQDHLHPRHTIRNLLLLLNSPNLGRTGSFTSNPDLIRSIEEVRHDREESSSSSENDDDVDAGQEVMTSEWEHVPVTLPEPTSDASYFVSTQIQSRFDNQANTTSTIAGGLMNSAAASMASFWRYTTGKQDK
ncbi:hypothetical protein CAPTEDRAFT_175681 [Capitella teleta]|uniref:Beclin 1-associated autophagy-related key regulator n=1 Tax=Capitella teleta TaxID=283909 RepID=R7T619_CAPTE|nr:hypothetical protein CAPTEDRAFT_175681 [Capitella teleta]|eukprot:ELT88688.1 hypothetical protein CAPTEDRAFT_175681 [Capitella teleta]